MTSQERRARRAAAERRVLAASIVFYMEKGAPRTQTVLVGAVGMYLAELEHDAEPENVVELRTTDDMVRWLGEFKR